MRYLLDSHTLLWWWHDQRRLSPVALELIANDKNEIVVSAVSAWEIATKHRLGKLPQLDVAAEAFSLLYARSLLRDRFEMLSISDKHGLRGGEYQLDHRDPFDRLLAAQSEIEDIPLVTRDPAFGAFPCETRW